MAVNSGDRKEVLIKVDGVDGGADTSRVVGPTNAGNIWREPSYDFWNSSNNEGESKKKGEEKSGIADNGSESYRFDFNTAPSKESAMEDPPSKLIGQFLHKQKASGEYCLDMDLEMAELQNDGVLLQRNLAPVSESPVNRVSFDPNPPGSSESVRRRRQHQLLRDSPNKSNNSNDGGGGGGGEGEIFKCSPRTEASLGSSASFKRKSTLLKERTKSRLLDPPPQHPPEKSGRVAGATGRSTQLRSGFLGKGSVVDEDEDDPLLEED